MSKKLILMPEMLEYHSKLIEAVFISCHINGRFLENKGDFKAAALPYMNNEFCYPLYLITGQLISELRRMRAEGQRTEDVVFIEPSVGDACRSGNYLAVIRNGLIRAGFPEVTVAPLSVSNRGRHSAFKITLKLVRGVIAAFCYGDALMQYYQAARLYDSRNGGNQVAQLYQEWQDRFCDILAGGRGRSGREMKENLRRLRTSMQPYADAVNAADRQKQSVRIGIAGEIYIKFCRLGNHDLENFLTENDLSYMGCGLMNYVLYRIDAEITKAEIACTPVPVLKVMHLFEQNVLRTQHIMARELGTDPYETVRSRAQVLISPGLVTGDGWLISAEIMELIERGCTNILVVHPFGCMVSHVCERGVMKKLHDVYPGVSIQTIEYDYDSSEALLQSRIMLAASSIF